MVRKAPTNFPLHSASYWKSVANQIVRTYVTLQPEPKTLAGVVSAVAQSKLKDISRQAGQDCVLTFLDLDSCGESQGPGMQPLLRKKFTVDTVLLLKLVQGSMLGRGSQRRDNDEATQVVDGDVVIIHDGFSHPGGQRDARAMFRLLTAKKDSEVDSELKDMISWWISWLHRWLVNHVSIFFPHPPSIFLSIHCDWPINIINSFLVSHVFFVFFFSPACFTNSLARIKHQPATTTSGILPYCWYFWVIITDLFTLKTIFFLNYSLPFNILTLNHVWISIP